MTHNGYEYNNNEPKEGDYVINTSYKKAIPMLVSKSEFGTLGIKTENGWFSWIVLRKHHKVVVGRYPAGQAFRS